MIRADGGLLERSLANLIENAVKYSPDGVKVLVKAGALRPPGEPGRVELRIVDRGPGVPEEAKERIFAPFQRYGDAPRGAGVGLGLAVARGFVEAMDGTVTAEDTPGGGLTMVVTLPAVDRLPDGRAPSDLLPDEHLPDEHLPDSRPFDDRPPDEQLPDEHLTDHPPIRQPRKAEPA